MSENTRGRKALAVVQSAPIPTNETAIAAAGQAANELAVIRDGVSAEQISFSQRIGARIGRRQTATVLQKLVTVTDLLELAEIKASKSYRETKVVIDGKVVTVTTWDEFCAVVENRSREQVDEDLRNLQAFGGEFLEAAQNLGIGYRQMRELRAVPADERVKLLEAAQKGDPKLLVEAAEDLIERHQAERTKLEKKATEATKSIAAKDAVIKDKDAKINELLEADQRRRSADPGEREAAQLESVRDAGLAAEMACRQLMKAAAEVISAPENYAAEVAARTAVEFVAQVLAGLINEAGVAVDFEEMVTPHWLKAVGLPANKTAGN